MILLEKCTIEKLNRTRPFIREGPFRKPKTGSDDKADDSGSQFYSNTSCCWVNTFRAVCSRAVSAELATGALGPARGCIIHSANKCK